MTGQRRIYNPENYFLENCHLAHRLSAKAHENTSHNMPPHTDGMGIGLDVAGLPTPSLTETLNRQSPVRGSPVRQEEAQTEMSPVCEEAHTGGDSLGFIVHFDHTAGKQSGSEGNPCAVSSLYLTPPKIKRETPKLGRVSLFPSAYQCPWLGRDYLVHGEILCDGSTIETDEGDCFER